MPNENTSYILYTDKETYFVEYLLNHLVLSDSITEAMIFTDLVTAIKFQQMLKLRCDLKCTVNTYIP